MRGNRDTKEKQNEEVEREKKRKMGLGSRDTNK